MRLVKGWFYGETVWKGVGCALFDFLPVGCRRPNNGGSPAVGVCRYRCLTPASSLPAQSSRRRLSLSGRPVPTCGFVGPAQIRAAERIGISVPLHGRGGAGTLRVLQPSQLGQGSAGQRLPPPAL